MKKILFLAGLFIIAGSVFAYNHYNNQFVTGRGCCSGHGGVCGCKNGRSQCCDGTQSPSCQCSIIYKKITKLNKKKSIKPPQLI